MLEHQDLNKKSITTDVLSDFDKKSAEVVAFLKERVSRSAEPILSIPIEDLLVDRRDRFAPQSPLWLGVQHFQSETNQFADVFPLSGTVIIDTRTKHNPQLANQAFDEMCLIPSCPWDDMGLAAVDSPR